MVTRDGRILKRRGCIALVTDVENKAIGIRGMINRIKDLNMGIVGITKGIVGITKGITMIGQRSMEEIDIMQKGKLGGKRDILGNVGIGIGAPKIGLVGTIGI